MRLGRVALFSLFVAAGCSDSTSSDGAGQTSTASGGRMTTGASSGGSSAGPAGGTCQQFLACLCASGTADECQSNSAVVESKVGQVGKASADQYCASLAQAAGVDLSSCGGNASDAGGGGSSAAGGSNAAGGSGTGGFGGADVPASVQCDGGPGANTPITLATGDPFDIVVDGTSVYWTTFGSCPQAGGQPCSGSVRKVSKCGGAVVDLATDLDGVRQVALTSKAVYWTSSRSSHGSGTLTSVPLNGGNVYDVVDDSYGDAAIAIGGNTVYYGSGLGDLYSTGSLRGTPQKLATGSVAAIAVDASFVYFTDYYSGSATANGSVDKVPLDGGQEVTLADSQNQPSGIVVSGDTVYWLNERDGTVMSVPKAGGTRTSLASGQAAPIRLATDGQSLYFVNYGDGTIAKVALTGGPVKVLAQAPRGAVAVAVDETSVYWAVPADPMGGPPGAIMKLTPK